MQVARKVIMRSKGGKLRTGARSGPIRKVGRKWLLLWAYSFFFTGLKLNREKRRPFKGTLMFIGINGEHFEKKAFSGRP
jgi:hypothetical protein